MQITPDFSEAVEGTSDPIPPGVYKTRVTGVEQKTSKADNQYLKVKLTIFGAEGDAAKYNNWPVFTNLMTTGKGAGRLKDFLKAAGLNTAGAFDTDALLGKEVVAVLVEGKMQDGTPSQWPEVKSVKAI